MHPPFKMPSMQVGSLHHEEVMRNSYRPKMLLFALDELFYIFNQIKKQQRADEKIVVAYKILCLSTQWCTERCHVVEKTSMPNALTLLNMEMLSISSASHGQSTMVRCWWASGPNFQETALGVWCWLTCISISTGAAIRGPLPSTHAGLLGLPGED